MMKPSMLLSYMLIVCSSGCVAQRTPPVLEAVGPMHRVTSFHQHQGSLLVYTALINNPNDPEHQWHSAYRIADSDGVLLRKVINQAGSFAQDPETIDLPAGRYVVTARAVNYGDVNVPVVINEGQNTVVDLNQEIAIEHPPLDHSWVRLPDGHVVGEKAVF